MSIDAATKNQLAQFGRTIALMFNRSLMYQSNHPFVQQSIDMFYEGARSLLTTISPLVFILNREEFYVDEAPLDPRINVGRILFLFKNNDIQSISIEPGLEKREVKVFLEVFGEIKKYSNVESFKKAIFSRGVTNIKINHVRYKKVTEDDEIIDRDTLKDLTPNLMTAEDEAKTRKMFMDSLLESVLTEEFAKTLNIESLMANPAAVSKNMIQADLEHVAAANEESGSGGAGGAEGSPDTGSGSPAAGGGPGGVSGAGVGVVDTGGDSKEGSGGIWGGDAGTGAGEGGMGGSGHGGLLVQQLDVMRMEVENHIAGKGDVEISQLADAIFDMKKQLLEGIEAQKALGVAYENESDILQHANDLTDQVLLQLVRDEYQKGEITPSRMAQIIRRLIPEADELKRLLPKIKAVLLDEGMSHTQYLELIQSLNKELQSEGLANILQASGEEIGVDGEQLIAEFKQNPEQAAQLIYLASEIRKGDGDDETLTEILAGYVEKMGGDLALEQAGEKDDPAHLQKVMGSIETSIVQQLGKMDVGNDVIDKLEKRLNDRMEAVLERMRAEWIQTRSRQEKEGGKGVARRVLSVLETLEQSVSEHDELGQILTVVREKVESGKIDENDYKAIQNEITLEKQRIKEKEANRVTPTGSIKAGAMVFMLEKEIARANRYDYSFSVLAFSMVRVKPQAKVPAGTIDSEILMESALAKMVEILRDVDIVGQMGKNTIVVVLPLIDREGSKKALNRVTTKLQGAPLLVNNIPVDVKFAGIAMTFDGEHTPDAKSFIRVMSARLQDMANRLKNIQSYMS